jgi:prepilin-type N-terminal cleavage/methylation domain-containing protein
MKIRNTRRDAFTMVELMIVVGIIAVIAGIAVPAWMRAREDARGSAVINEMRQLTEAFQSYATDNNNSYPASGSNFSVVPDGMAGYMPQNTTWAVSPPGGGYWYWINVAPVGVWGFNGFVGLYNSGLSTATVENMDALLDGESDLNNGAFRTDGSPPPTPNSWILYGLQ